MTLKINPKKLKLISLAFLLVIFVGRVSAMQEIDTILVKELERMVEIDQVATMATPSGQYSELSQSQWELTKDSIFRAHKSVIESVFDSIGYPGYDKVGKTGETWFWVLVQHSDFDPQFQHRVLKEMAKEVGKGNASPQNYAYLTDRVNLNFGEQQIYGTQVTYDFFTGHAEPKDLKDPENVGSRREEIGLEPLEKYLDEMTEMHNQNNLMGFITNTALLYLVLIILVAFAIILFGKRRRTKAGK